MKKLLRKKTVLLFGLVSLIQSGFAITALCCRKKHKAMTTAMSISLLVTNAVFGALFLCVFISENLPSRKLAKKVTYENSDDGIFDFDIDALTDDEIESLLK